MHSQQTSLAGASPRGQTSEIWGTALVAVLGVCVFVSPLRPAGVVSVEELGLLLLLAAYTVLGGASRSNDPRLTRTLAFFAVVLVLSCLAALLAEVGWPLEGILWEQLLLRFQGALPLDQLEIYQVPRATMLLLEGLGVLWMASGTLSRPRSQAQAASLLILVASWGVLVGLYQRATGAGLPQHWEDLEPLLQRVGSIYGDPNVFGSILCLLLPVVVVQSRRSRRLVSVLLALLSVGVVSCVLLSWSRAALGALLLGGLVLGWLVWRSFVRRAGSLWRIGCMVGLGLLLALGIGASVAQEGSALHFWLEKSFGQKRWDDVLGGRLEVWAAGGRMVSDFPLLGSGPGSAYRRYALYGPATGALAEGVHVDPSLEGRNLHNTYLQMAAETGLLGLGCFLLLLFTVIAGGFRSSSRLRSAASAGATLFLLTCLTGHPLLDRGAALLFWFVCGLAAAEPLGECVPKRSGRVLGFWSLLGIAGTLQIGTAVWVGRESVYELGLYSEPTAGRRFEELKISGVFSDPQEWVWMGRRAQLRVWARGAAIRIPVLLRHRDIESQPVDVGVRVDGELRLRRRFTSSGGSQLLIPLLPSEQERRFVRLDFEVSRTHIPAVGGLSQDPRPLGMAMSALSFEAQGLGGWHPAEPIGRWSRLWVEGVRRDAEHSEIRFEIAHPGLEVDPLRVKVYGMDRLLQEVVVHQPGSVRIGLDAAVRPGTRIRLELSRTWSPLSYSLSADPRELGALFSTEELARGVIDFDPETGEEQDEKTRVQLRLRGDSEQERGNP